MWVSINKRLVCTVYPKFFSVNMIFSAVQTLGTIKYAWGLIAEGVHGDPCQFPDYHIAEDTITTVSNTDVTQHDK